MDNDVMSELLEEKKKDFRNAVFTAKELNISKENLYRIASIEYFSDVKDYAVSVINEVYGEEGNE